MVSLFSNAQTDPDQILIGGNKRPEVLLVGTFHFAYYDQDLYKTDKDKRVDILSKKRQKEIQELVEYISLFKPTKIFVEDFNKDNILMKNYRNYKNGNYKLTADEIDQLAYRLMDNFELDTLYGVDEKTIFQTLYSKPETKNYASDLSKGFDLQKDFLESDIGKRYMKWYEIDDSLKLENSMLDYFKILNSPISQKRGFYSLFAGTFGYENTDGADILTLSLVSRNMRILNHIERNINSPDERILILFGSSHTDFFKLFYNSSPEHKLIDFNELYSLEMN
ncbi:hypothetical protein GCM10009433_24590 [Psychroflexus lacisalsi]|uniref:TraB/GumN family protein n=1 Tax=Psychroflexus lacisalsi TaxID=503928 RepID=A0ABP3VQR8_9FLAO